jgi:2,4-dichlorophenol 6-monooxygenase
MGNFDGNTVTALWNHAQRFAPSSNFFIYVWRFGNWCIEFELSTNQRRAFKRLPGFQWWTTALDITRPYSVREFPKGARSARTLYTRTGDNLITDMNEDATKMIETHVLIIGSGPAGSMSALALSSYGIRNMIVTKYRWLADTPRAHITNQRTFEILRDFGVEAEAKALAVPLKDVGHSVFCTSLAGEELARIRTFGSHPTRQADHIAASPCEMGDLPQNLLEPVLLGNAAARGTHVRFNTEYLSLEQSGDSVVATVRDRLDDHVYQIKAKYLIGADGGRSKVVDDIGLPTEGSLALAGSVNIIFDADLSKYVVHRPAVLYLIVQPGLEADGVGMGILRMVRPWKEWMVIKGHDLSQRSVLTEAEAIQTVRDLIGVPDLQVRIKSISLWTVNNLYATRYSAGRVFCVGDAVHRHPPTNGLGSNTSIQDAYNLAWKLALVLKGKAAPSLLDSYDLERVPVGRQVVKRANDSIESYGAIFKALGMLDSKDAAEGLRNMERLKEATEQASVQRESLRQAIVAKNYEYNTHGVEMNQRYTSQAVISDGTSFPVSDRDPELHYIPTTCPGARLPHVWLQRDGLPVSTLDIVGKGRFSMLTGIGGDMWTLAAGTAAERYGIPVDVYMIGPGCTLTDLYGEWTLMREIDEAGCLLVRPDGHVGWRAGHAACDAQSAERRLSDALGLILGKSKKAHQTS